MTDSGTVSEIRPSGEELLLRACDLCECEATCCYDGVYIMTGEEEMICELLRMFPEQFEGVPERCIVDGNWMGVIDGRKTAVVPYEYSFPEFPAHFARTRCVFADAHHLCRLETLSRDLGVHKWTFKPTACWLFPLRLNEHGVVPPPLTAEEDPDRMEGYPGFSCYTPCGQHRIDGRPWQEVLRDEISYYEQAQRIPVWAGSGLSVKEIIARAKRKETATNSTE